MRVGVLSDTHGLLRPEVLERLAGCDRLIHAGDVGDAQILESLAAIAPTWTVRGNMDVSAPLTSLPEVVRESIDEWQILVTHRRADALEKFAREAEAQTSIVIYGHSHRPEIEWRGPSLWLNPGACGSRRFRLPLTIAFLTFVDGRVVPEIVSVEPQS